MMLYMNLQAGDVLVDLHRFILATYIFWSLLQFTGSLSRVRNFQKALIFRAKQQVALCPDLAKDPKYDPKFFWSHPLAKTIRKLAEHQQVLHTHIHTHSHTHTHTHTCTHSLTHTNTGTLLQ